MRQCVLKEKTEFHIFHFPIFEYCQNHKHQVYTDTNTYSPIMQDLGASLQISIKALLLMPHFIKVTSIWPPITFANLTPGACVPTAQPHSMWIPVASSEL